MKKTQTILLFQFFCPLLVSAVLYVLGEFAGVDMTLWPDLSDQWLFILSTAMILLTLGGLPLALRLFRFPRVAADLGRRGAQALHLWGGVRLLILGTLLVFNTLLYYLCAFEPTFGYLAVVTLLTFPFVVPTRRRCNEEARPLDPPAETSTDTCP